MQSRPRKRKTPASAPCNSKAKVWHRFLLETGSAFGALDTDEEKSVEHECALMAYWQPTYEAQGIPIVIQGHHHHHHNNNNHHHSHNPNPFLLTSGPTARGLDHNLAVTPPMSLPLMDANSLPPSFYNTTPSYQHQHQQQRLQHQQHQQQHPHANDNSTTSPCSSPFRQHNMTVSLPPGDMSPHELHPQHHHALMTSAYDNANVLPFLFHDTALPLDMPSRPRNVKPEQGLGLSLGLGLGLGNDFFPPTHQRGDSDAMMSYLAMPAQDTLPQQENWLVPRAPIPQKPRRNLPTAGHVLSQSSCCNNNNKAEPRPRHLQDYLQHTLPPLPSTTTTTTKKTTSAVLIAPKRAAAPPNSALASSSAPCSSTLSASASSSSSSTLSSPPPRRRMLRPRGASARTTTFQAPGADMPGFVPLAHRGRASAAQGNRWPIARELLEQIVAAERSVGGGKEQRLTYKEIKAKYDAWQISESTLRGIKRVFELPREHRERVPTWNAEHIRALELAVPRCMERKKILWGQVVESIKRQTGKPFGAGTCRKKWESLHPEGVMNITAPTSTTSKTRQSSLSEEEEKEEEEAEDSSSPQQQEEEKEITPYGNRSDTSSEDSDVLSQRFGASGFVSIPGNVPVAWPLH